MNLVSDIWRSFRAMPIWVQIWVALILVPVNMAAIFFVFEPHGILIATLAIGGMMPILAIMIYERGLSKAMGIPHLLIWTPLVVIIWQSLDGATGEFASYLWILLAIDLISLGFDYPDMVKWIKGDRAIAS